MHAYSDRIRVAWLPSALLTMLLSIFASSCSSTQILEAPGTCVQGQSALCTCESGAVGFRSCGDDSEYSPCRCDAPNTGGAGGTGGQPIAGAAGSPIGGSAGIGGAAGGGGVNPMAGVGGSAGAGIGGVSGMTAGMTGGSAGVAGIMMSGGVGGVSGMDATGGTSGDDGSGGMSGPGRDPKPGELYGDCRDNGGCDDGLLCVNDGSSGMQESYCSTTCNALEPMPCPRSRGDGMVICVFGFCVR
jgi:hypothetical protein